MKKIWEKRWLIVLGIIILVAFILVVGNTLPTREPARESNTIPKPAIVTKYRVIKSTGLYSSASIDADMVEELEVGAILEPFGSKLTCVKLDELGTIYELCRMKSTKSGVTGWVLRKWFE